MSKSILNAKAFQTEKAAYEWLENRIWPEGPVCPHCDGFERIGKMKGSATRFGLYKCYQCRKQFRATVGTVFEKSHVPMTLWLQAMYLLASSKKGISANQLHRTFGVSLKTAWFIAHRLRLAMTAVGLQAPMGGEGKIVEADEAYMGSLRSRRLRRRSVGASPSSSTVAAAGAPSAPSSDLSSAEPR